MGEAEAVDPGAQVSHEVDGRVLTGVGVSVDALAETMDRHSEPEEAPAASQPPAAASASPTPPPQTRGQKRFAELTREREDARREAADAKRERDELRARLAAPRQEPAREPEPARQTEPTPSATRSKPTEDEIGTKYQSYGDFVEDLADWKAEQRFAALDFDAHVRKGIEADRASRSFEDLKQSKIASARETFPDFDTVIRDGPGVKVNLNRPVAPILSLPFAEHVLYAIAKDGELADRLSRMSDFEFGIAIAALAPAAPVAHPASTGPAVSVVPAPYSPVGSGSRTASVPLGDLPKRAGFDFDKSGYREKRAAERAGRH